MMYLFNKENTATIKAMIWNALAEGAQMEAVADQLTELMNQVQKEYDDTQSKARKAEASKALAAALSAFGKAYTGEEVPVQADALEALGEELRKLVSDSNHGVLGRFPTRIAATTNTIALSDFANNFLK